MKRFATLILLAAAIAAISAAASAHAESAATSTSAEPATVATKFPAAGELLVNSVIARRNPAPSAAKIKVFHYFRTDYRIQQILAYGTKTGSDGKVWYHISVPMRPNGTLGWIPASSVDLKPTVSQIVVDVGSRTIDVFRHGNKVLHGKVAVGRPGMETPLGKYYVTATFVPDVSYLGVYALETSAYSKLSEWPGGGVVGIHGTNEPWLLGQAVSHGCIRVANSTASGLKRLTPLGTPILVKA